MRSFNKCTSLSSSRGGSRHHVDFDANESAFDELAKHVKNKSASEVSSVRATYFLGTLAGVGSPQAAPSSSTGGG